MLLLTSMFWPLSTGWIKTERTWVDQCPNLESVEEQTAAECVQLCRENSRCTAVIYSPDLESCQLLQCEFPVPIPQTSQPGYVGYYQGKNTPMTSVGTKSNFWVLVLLLLASLLFSRVMSIFVLIYSLCRRVSSGPWWYLWERTSGGKVNFRCFRHCGLCRTLYCNWWGAIFL